MNGGGVGVVINFDEKSKKCKFDQCVFYASGKCTGFEERDACVDMALKMLGVDYADTEKKDNNRQPVL